MSIKKLNDKDIMNLLIDTAIANGATSADCVLSRSRGVSITRRLGKDENIQRYEDFDTGLRVFVDNKILPSAFVTNALIWWVLSILLPLMKSTWILDTYDVIQ